MFDIDCEFRTHFYYFVSFPNECFSLKRYCLRDEYLGMKEPNYGFA